MNKRKVRCYQAFTRVSEGLYNYPVYYLVYDGWASFSLVTCIACGELFVIDWSDPKKKGLGLTDIAASTHCPTCNSPLKNTLRNYPASIRLPDGRTGTYTPGNRIPPDDESLILDIFDLT